MPSIGNLSVDVPLTNISILPSMNYGFIADMVFPAIQSAKKTGKIWRIDNVAENMRMVDSKRAPGSEAKVVDFEVDSSTTYDCEDHALTGYVPDEARAQADPPVQAYVNKTKALTDRLRLIKENEIVAQLDATFTGALTSAVGTAWGTYATSTPMSDINSVMTTVVNRSGRVPNAIAMDEAVARVLMHHPTFLARITSLIPPDRSTANLDLVGAILKAELGLEYIHIAKTVLKNTAAEGAAKSLSKVWGTRVFVFYKEGNPGFETGNTGVHVKWNAADSGGGLQDGMRVESWREAKRKSDGLMVGEFYDQIVLNSNAGHLLTSAI